LTSPVRRREIPGEDDFMKIRRSHLTLLGSAVLALVAMGVFLWIRFGRSDAEHSKEALPIRPSVELSPKVVEEPKAPAVPEPAPTTAATIAPAAPPTQPPVSSPVAPQVMAQRFEEIGALGDASADYLRKRIDADPELSEVLKAKLKPLEQPLMYITYAQGLNDPQFRHSILEMLGDDRKIGLFLQYISEAAGKYGITKANTPIAKTAEERASLLKALEPHFQAEYDRLVEKMQIDEEMVDHLVRIQARESLYYSVVGYLAKRGWNWNVTGRKFEPPK
jgi:hypothetical protein